MTDIAQPADKTPPPPPPAPAPAPEPKEAPPASPAPAPAPKAGEEGNAPAAPAPKPGETSGDGKESAPPSPASQPEFKVPDQFKDKGWATKVKSLDDVFKQIDELDALKGKKAVRPDMATATPEEREAFYASGRPKDLAEYKFTDGIAVDDMVKASVPQMLSKYGIDTVTGNDIIKDYQAMEQALVAQQYDPVGFTSSMKTAFGDNWENITGQTKNLLKGMMSPEDYTVMDALPNQYLGIIYRTLGKVHQAFGITETNTAHLQPPGGPAPVDMDTKRANLRGEINKLSQNPSFNSDKLAQLNVELNDTYKNDPRRTDGGRK